MPETAPRPEGLPETMLQPVDGAFLDHCESCDNPACGCHGVAEPQPTEPTWTVAVEVPLSLPNEMRHDLFSAVAAVVRDWEPDDRDGWDAEVYGCPTAQQPTAPRPDVPDDIHKLAVATMNANDALPEDERDMTPHHILAAVLPAHKWQVRERVAAEIEAEAERLDHGDDRPSGMAYAAQITRGES